MVVLVWLSAGSLCGCVLPPAVAVKGYSGVSGILGVWPRGDYVIGCPVDEVTGALASLETDFPGVRFMVFGFGERNYLMAGSAGPVKMLSALFPSKSAILMTALRASPAEAFADEQVRTLRLSHDQLDRLADLIWRGLEKAADGVPRIGHYAIKVAPFNRAAVAARLQELGSKLLPSPDEPDVFRFADNNGIVVELRVM